MAKVGRKSAYVTKIKPRFKEIESWCRDGLIETQMAALLGVGLTTFWKYKSEKTEFAELLKTNKDIIDSEVEDSLLKRALGYEYEEVTEEYYIDTKKVTGDIKKVKPDKIHRKTIKKFMPPDVTAQIFWLKNRQHEKWRDKKKMEIYKLCFDNLKL